MVNEIKPIQTIDKHINLNKNNFVFLSEVKTDLLLYGYNTNYTELINLAIETLNRLLKQSGNNKEARIKKLYEIMEISKKE